MTKALSIPALLLLGTVACSLWPKDDGQDSKPGTDLYCTSEFRAGITVEVRDAITGAPLACGASGNVREGDYVEELTDSYQCAIKPDYPYLAGAWERAGIYTVTVQRPGYDDWVQGGIVVTADECHVHGVSLQVPLEPVLRNR